MIGTIKVLKDSFGFIKSDEITNGDIFFHLKNLEWIAFNELNIWDKVSFEITDWKNWKKQWINVKIDDENENV